MNNSRGTPNTPTPFYPNADTSRAAGIGRNRFARECAARALIADTAAVYRLSRDVYGVADLRTAAAARSYMLALDGALRLAA